MKERAAVKRKKKSGRDALHKRTYATHTGGVIFRKNNGQCGQRPQNRWRVELNKTNLMYLYRRSWHRFGDPGNEP